MRYTKYKNLYRLSCFGSNDIWRTRTDSQYRTTGVNFTNGKTCRFNFNGAFNDVILSENARLVLESAFIPTVTNANYVNIRIVTSSQDKVFDTVKQISGNPILLTFPGTNQTILNYSDYTYCFNVPKTFLSQGYIDVEIESPVVTANITFTGGALDRFLLTFVIIQEDDEIVQDETLAPKVEYKNFGRMGMPIRTPLT